MSDSPDATSPAASWRFASVLVGIDGSAESSHAASFAGALAARIGATVIAVHAVGLREAFPEDPQDAGARDPHDRVAELMHGAWTESLRRTGASHEIVLEDGPPAAVIVRIADARDADLVVVGTRGVGQADPFGLGSVASRLTRESTRPVVVIPVAPPPT